MTGSVGGPRAGHPGCKRRAWPWGDHMGSPYISGAILERSTDAQRGPQLRPTRRNLSTMSKSDRRDLHSARGEYHILLTGTFQERAPDATKPGACSWM